ncbi:MAG: monovalent cation/H+ antiporter subunit D family protein [Peptostreptococcaceae bacterium]|nr:monovalent cation/H+ antiporter subunit D family protein [Peptostreptococcaceae bacterium]
MPLYNSYPLIIILILFISAFAIPLFKSIRMARIIGLSAAGVSLVLSVLTLSGVRADGPYYFRVGHFAAPWGIEFHIGIIEGLMAVLFMTVSMAVLWFSIYSIDHDLTKKKIPLFYTLVNLLVGSLLGIVFSDDLFNCFVFIEISSIASCGIVVIKDKKENIKAALKYLILSSLGSGLVLMGIALIYSLTGHLNMASSHEVLVAIYPEHSRNMLIAIGLFTVGLGVKSAMFPLHTWLPDAHTYAPAVSSALLSALVLKAYVILYIKIIYRVFGMGIVSELPVLNIVLLLGAVGMIAGSVLAIMQKNLKRMVAYSSVAQIGYVFFGIGLGTTMGLAAAIFQIFNHAFTKAALFLSAGSIIEKTGKKNIADLKGIGKEMPFTLAIFAIGGMSLVGIPLLSGFNSKWNFAVAAIEAQRVELLAVVLVSSLLNALYYFPVIINGYFGEESLEGKVYKNKERPVKELLPILVLVLGIIYLGVSGGGLLSLIEAGIPAIK